MSQKLNFYKSDQRANVLFNQEKVSCTQKTLSVSDSAIDCFFHAHLDKKRIFKNVYRHFNLKTVYSFRRLALLGYFLRPVSKRQRCSDTIIDFGFFPYEQPIPPEKAAIYYTASDRKIKWVRLNILELGIYN